MKKVFLLMFILIIALSLTAQYVGIGTTTPQSKLQINHRSSTAPGLKLVDSATNFGGVLQFQNVNFSSGMRISGFSQSNFNNGHYIDFLSDSITGVTFKGNGFTGIRNLDPAYPLDVNGDINTTGSIRVNGTDGAAGQVLMKNDNGDLSWQYPEEFRNINSFVTPGTGTWIVPAGVTRIKVELWGGGAAGASFSSGGAGAYIMSILSVAPAQTWSYTVGAGGSGSPGASGTASIFSRAASGITLTAGGGTSFGSPSLFSAAGTVSFFGLQGQAGTVGSVSFQSSGGINYRVYQNAPGGNAPRTTNTGGQSGTAVYTITGGTLTDSFFGGNGAQPGGGGGGGANSGVSGGHGMVVVYW